MSLMKLFNNKNDWFISQQHSNHYFMSPCTYTKCYGTSVLVLSVLKHPWRQCIGR